MKFSKIKLQMVQEQNFNYNSKTISSATDIVKYINNIEELEKATEEYTILICLNCKNQIIAYTEIAKGGNNLCFVDMKSIFKNVLMCNASKFILVHNHPSQMADPSKKDIEITKHIKQASEIMNIEFLDHIIVGGNNFVSCLI